MTSSDTEFGVPTGSPPAWRSAWRHVLPAFVISRVLIVLAGVVAISWWGVVSSPDLRFPSSPVAAVQMWVHWDAAWYLTIATVGYTTPVAIDFDMRPNFFPGFPVLIWAVAKVVGGPVAAGLLVSNASCLVFLVCLWRLIAEDLGRHVATRTVWVVMLFPTSFYLSGIYAESTMLAAVTVCLVAIRRRIWWLAAIAAGTASLSRTLGLLVFVLVAWECWRSRAAWRTRVLAIGGIGFAMAAALGTWMSYLALALGNPLKFVEVQHLSRSETTWPWLAFQPWIWYAEWFGYGNSTTDAAFAVLALGLALVVCFRWNAAYGLYALLAVLVPLTTGLVSFSRLMLAAFPCFVAVAALTERRAVRVAWLAVSIVLLAVLTARYSTGQWVA